MSVPICGIIMELVITNSIIIPHIGIFHKYERAKISNTHIMLSEKTY